METKPPIPLAVLVGIQTPEIDDIAHEASLEELGRLVKTVGYEVVGTLSQKRDGTGAASLLGSGKLAELAALTGGTGFVGSMAPPSKFEAAMVDDVLVLPYAKQRLIGEVYESARVLFEGYDENGRVLNVRGLPGAIARLRRSLAAH